MKVQNFRTTSAVDSIYLLFLGLRKRKRTYMKLRNIKAHEFRSPRIQNTNLASEVKECQITFADG